MVDVVETVNAAERAVSEARGRIRQNKAVPWLIRDDGMLFPNVPLIAKKQNFRPYRGKLDATLAERLRYLEGVPGQRPHNLTLSGPVEEEAPPFDLRRASKDECISIALEQFGQVLDPSKHVSQMRAEVARMAGLIGPKPGSGAGTPALGNAAPNGAEG